MMSKALWQGNQVAIKRIVINPKAEEGFEIEPLNLSDGKSSGDFEVSSISVHSDMISRKSTNLSKISSKNSSKKYQAMFSEEVSILAKLRHSNVSDTCQSK